MAFFMEGAIVIQGISESFLVVEPEADLAVDLARIIVVKAAERHAVINQHASIRKIDTCHRKGCALPEVLADRSVYRVVLRQIFSWVGLVRVSIYEARSVIHVC